MSIKHLPYPVTLFVCLSLACLTVNVYFYPSKKVDDTAMKIAADIRGAAAVEQEQENDSNTDDKTQEPMSQWWHLINVAYATETETTVSNPTITAIKTIIKTRAPSLDPHFKSGAIGEGNNGLIIIRDIAAAPMRARAKLNAIVKEENTDRQELYQEIAKALGVKDQDLPKLQKSFAKEWQKSAAPGWWIQDDTGNWQQR